MLVLCLLCAHECAVLRACHAHKSGAACHVLVHLQDPPPFPAGQRKLAPQAAQRLASLELQFLHRQTAYIKSQIIALNYYSLKVAAKV